jgi:hypothetical protein
MKQLGLSLIVLCVATSASLRAEEGFRSLFNGTNLKG